MAEVVAVGPLFRLLTELGMTNVVGVPDNGTAAFFERAAAAPDVDLLTVSREGEAFGVAAGLWLGGRQPVVVVQNTGLLEAGDALRGTVYRMGVPLPILVGVRGFAKMRALHRDIAADRAAGRTAQTMQRAAVDSAALLTEPTLEAWNVPHTSYQGEADGGRVRRLLVRSRDAAQPVAITLPLGLG